MGMMLSIIQSYNMYKEYTTKPENKPPEYIEMDVIKICPRLNSMFNLYGKSRVEIL